MMPATMLLLATTTMKYLPFYSIILMRVHIICQLLGLWNGLVIAASLFIQPKGNMVLLLGGVPLCILAAKSLATYLKNQVVFLNIKKIKSEGLKLLHLALMQLMATGSNRERLMVAGICRAHQISCSDCASKFAGNIQCFDKECLTRMIAAMYDECSVSMNNSASIYINQSMYLLYGMRSIVGAIRSIFKACKTSTSYGTNTAISIAMINIKNHIKLQNKGVCKVFTRLTKVIKFTNLYEALRNNIRTECHLQLKLWVEMHEGENNQNYYSECLKAILKIQGIIESQISKIKAIYDNYTSANIFIQGYMATIRKMPTKQEQAILPEDICFHPKTAVLVVDTNSATLGNICEANGVFYSMFKIPLKKAVNVQQIMPQCYAERHTQFMNDFFAYGNGKLLHKESSIIAQTYDGFALRVTMVVQYCPSLKHSLMLVGLIRPIPDDRDIIVTNLNGTINSVSEHISSCFGLPSKVHEFSINIRAIAPSLIFSWKTSLQKYKSGGEELEFSFSREILNAVIEFNRQAYSDNESPNRLKAFIEANNSMNAGERVDELNFNSLKCCSAITYQCRCEVADYKYSVRESSQLYTRVFFLQSLQENDYENVFSKASLHKSQKEQNKCFLIKASGKTQQEEDAAEGLRRTEDNKNLLASLYRSSIYNSKGK